jgi:hypothetical protein
MPNNGRITLCPYYRDERNLSISCEDVYRTFRWEGQKKRYMDTYCDSSWESCPHAKELNRLYSRMGDNEKMNSIEKLKHMEKELRRELRSVSTALGKSKHREEEKNSEIKKLRQQRDAAQKLYTKARGELDECREKEDRLMEELNGITLIYEARIAYLMQLCGGELDENAARKWACSHDYTIFGDMDGTDISGWKLVTQEVEDGTSRFARALPGAGAKEAAETE